MRGVTRRTSHPCNSCDHRQIMWTKSGFLFVSRVIFPGDVSESDSAICSHNSDLNRLLLYRLEVLEAALLQLGELQGKAAPGALLELNREARTRVHHDSEMRPVTAMCTACREQMPKAPSNLRSTFDLVLWLSTFFIEHKRLKHPDHSNAQIVSL